MKFAVPYYLKDSPKWMDSASEIIIDYSVSHTEEELVDFLKIYPDKRIVLDVMDVEGFIKNNLAPYTLKHLKDKYNLHNWAIRFPVSHNDILTVEKYLKAIQDIVIFPYFYLAPVETFEQLDRFLHMNVTDIYITNALAFDLQRVKEKRDSFETVANIRIYPNICQSYWADEQSVRTFFVRPEDVDYYEPYVDIFEIYAETRQQKQMASIYFDIYKSKSWLGDLKEYLINCNYSITNEYLPKNFGEYRLKCRKKCVITSQCDFCNQCQRLSDMIKTTAQRFVNVEEGADSDNK